MNPLLPKTIIGQNNSSLEINWTNYVAFQNPLNNYFLQGGVSDNCVIFEPLPPVKGPQKGIPGSERWDGSVSALIWLEGARISRGSPFLQGNITTSNNLPPPSHSTFSKHPVLPRMFSLMSWGQGAHELSDLPSPQGDTHSPHKPASAPSPPAPLPPQPPSAHPRPRAPRPLHIRTTRSTPTLLPSLPL